MHDPSPSILRRFALVVLAVALVDLATKELATAWLGLHGMVRVARQVTLLLVYNTGNAGGGTIGPFTWHVNVAVTVIAVVLMTSVVTHLAVVDRRAVYAMGAVSGGAVGNLASLLFGPPGVADFLGIHLPSGRLMVANVADLALWLGALLLVPVALTILRVIILEPQRAFQRPGHPSLTPP